MGMLTVPPVRFPHIETLSSSAHSTTNLNSATVRAGMVFFPRSGINLTAVQFSVSAVAAGGGTVQADLFPLDASGNPDIAAGVLATGSIATPAAGEYTITFSTPYTPSTSPLGISLKNIGGTPGTNYPTIAYGMTLHMQTVFPFSLTHNGTSWTKQNATPLIAMHDTQGELPYHHVGRAVSSHAFKQDTGVADEYGIKITPTQALRVRALELIAHIPVGANFVLSLTKNDSAGVASIVVNANTIATNSVHRRLTYPVSNAPYPYLILEPPNFYRLSIQPNQTAANVTIYSHLFDSMTDLEREFGSGVHGCTRLDLGAWTEQNTSGNSRMYPLGLIVDAFGSSRIGGGSNVVRI